MPKTRDRDRDRGSGLLSSLDSLASGISVKRMQKHRVQPCPPPPPPRRGIRIEKISSRESLYNRQIGSLQCGPDFVAT